MLYQSKTHYFIAKYCSCSIDYPRMSARFYVLLFCKEMFLLVDAHSNIAETGCNCCFHFSNSTKSKMNGVQV